MGGSNATAFPVLFEKPWSTLVYEPNPVKLIKGNTNKIDHEVELGIVIGKEAKNIDRKNYLDYIDYYFVCLDLSDRTYQASKYLIFII